MKRLVVVVGLLAIVVFLSACGGGGSSASSATPESAPSNQEKVEANAARESTNAALERELLKTLKTDLGLFDEKDVGVENVYEVGGGICNVTGIYTSERDIEVQERSPNGLVSPEGDAVVSVNYMIDPNSNQQATLAECQEGALYALGWGGSSTRATKAEWIEHADEICKAGDEALKPFEAKATGLSGEMESDPQEGFQKLAELTDELPEVARPFYEELRAIPIPDGEEEIVDKILAAIESQTAYGPRMSAALREEDIAKVEEITQESEATKERTHGLEQGYGLKVCGSQG